MSGTCLPRALSGVVGTLEQLRGHRRQGIHTQEDRVKDKKLSPSERLAKLPHENLVLKPDTNWVLGSPPHAMLAAWSAVVDYLCWLGSRFTDSTDRRAQIVASKKAIYRHIAALLARILYGTDHIREVLGEKNYRISAGSFFQTNSYQVQRLYDLAVELARPEGIEYMLDLYSGTGTIAIYFSSLVKSVLGVEAAAEAVADAQTNAQINSASNCQFLAVNVEDYLKQAALSGESPDLIVIDPPRAGCHPTAIDSLIALKAEKLVYISCNPATLARDIKQFMEAGYVLERAVPIDLFPHTYHIEAACRLTLLR